MNLPDEKKYYETELSIKDKQAQLNEEKEELRKLQNEFNAQRGRLLNTKRDVLEGELDKSSTTLISSLSNGNIPSFLTMLLAC